LAEVHVRTLRRAAELVGGEQALALRLQVTPSHLALWLAGVEVPPADVFLRAVDIVMDHVQPSSPVRGR
jgi:DNA-binding transcriptional regulator YdaS (Cro superfamily)